MNYVLLDLEWNDAYCKKLQGFVNEIVEFGAVKLDEKFNEIDTFSIIVRSSITNRLSGRFKELTGMTNEQMQSGVPFEEAITLYKNWVGDNAITLTWSNSDLHTLYHNAVNFMNDFKAAEIGRYVDLQKYFHSYLASIGTPQKNQISLANAATLLDIKVKNEVLHHALADSYIAAEIFKKCYNESNFDSFIVNTSSGDFYKRMMYKVHYINNMNDPLINKNDLFVLCPKCKNKSKRVASWHLKKPWFHSSFVCSNCNLKFKGAVALKKFFDKVEIKKRVFEPSAKKTNEKNNTNNENGKKLTVEIK